MFENITLEKIIASEETIISFPPSMLLSYSHFVKYFNDLNTLNLHNLVIGINFVYGWMPTMFDFKNNDFEVAINLLNKVKNNNRLETQELSVLKSLFNNSIVGTSKLLHFINPSLYAIWDSRVSKYLLPAYNYNLIASSDIFIEYQNFCQRITNLVGYQRIHNSMVQKVGYNITKYRSLELIMYSAI